MSVLKKINWQEILAADLFLYRLIGIICATISFKGFLIPNHFLDGGVNGISILLNKVYDINISVLIILLNIPFIMLGYDKIGKYFAINSAISILLLALFLQFVHVPVITTDKLLIAIFGGFMMGLAIGFIIKSGGVIDGLEVLAEYTTINSRFNASELILLINCILFLSAAYQFGIEIAMYSIITFYTALKVSTYVVDGFDHYTEMKIISKEYEAIKNIIVNDFGKAITVYKGERGYLPTSFETKHDCEIIVTVLTRLDIFHIRRAILKVDPAAFIYIQSIKEVKGGVVKKLRHHG